MSNKKLPPAELKYYAANFDTSYEDSAVSARGEFLRAYPADRLSEMPLDDYAIGNGTTSFCAHVEAKTKAWANIQGATANKFGIYYGRTKSDPTKKYRFTKKFGKTKEQAYDAIKAALLELLQTGKTQDFAAIDKNPLSQMFKAKILSLYFPEQYLNICSSEHLQLLAANLGLPENLPSSEYQNLLIAQKNASAVAKTWSNPKFMSFLYERFFTDDSAAPPKVNSQEPKGQRRRKIDFTYIQESRERIGKLSEEFAILWEKNRLLGLGLEHLSSKIIDQRQHPSHGYDFLSHSAPGMKRRIEVKSIGFDRNEKSYRFFLSENERVTSLSDIKDGEYYFYLVSYGKDGKPKDLIAKPAHILHAECEVSPCAYVVWLEPDNTKVTHRNELRRLPDS